MILIVLSILMIGEHGDDGANGKSFVFEYRLVENIIYSFIWSFQFCFFYTINAKKAQMALMAWTERTVRDVYL